MDDVGYQDDEAGNPSQIACDVCGSKHFTPQGGFYYCSTCNTQSQLAQEYGADEFQFGGRTSGTVGVTVFGKTRKRKASGAPKKLLTSWEVLNLVLKAMTDKLVEIGFPPLLKDKVFQLWRLYLVKRRAVICENEEPDGQLSRVTTGEPHINLAVIYNWKAKRKQRRRKWEAEPSNHAMRLRIAKAKRQAFEEAYMRTVGESQQNHEAIAAIPKKKKTEEAKAFQLTPATARVFRAYGKSKSFVVNPKSGVGTYRALLKQEKLSIQGLVIILFIAARQIGCRVMFTDFIRLVCDGTLYVNSLQHLLSPDDLKNYNLSSNGFLNMSHGQAFFRKSLKVLGSDIETMIHFIGVKKFQYPKFQELLPKFTEDFALPREFESWLSKINKYFDTDEDLVEIGQDPSTTPYKILIEVIITAMIAFLMCLLFGLDDVTERHQSRFAMKVNEILAKHLDDEEIGTDPRAEWSQLFEIESWFQHIRLRTSFIDKERLTPPYFSFQAPPNLIKANDINTRFGIPVPDVPDTTIKVEPGLSSASSVPPEQLQSHRTEDGETRSEETKEGGYKAEKQTAAASLRGIFQKLAAASYGSQIPEIPDYVSLPYPNKSIVHQYESSKPNIAYPNFNQDILLMDFAKRRIDFIINPEKYIPLLENAGYTVKIIPGTATNCTEVLKFRTRKLYLFQPFMKFDRVSFSKQQQIPASLQFVLDSLSKYIHVLDNHTGKYRPDMYNMLERLSYLYMLRCVNGFIPFSW